MKFNKQKIEEIKQKMNSIKDKMEKSKNEKVPRKYYALLILMLMLGGITLINNIKQYNISNKEEYKEYYLENESVNSEDINISNYITAESSISTNISNMIEEQVVETLSNNEGQQTNNSNYVMPVEGEIIKEYATEKLVYSDTLGMWKTHPGIDIKAQLNTEVKSVSNGKVQCVVKDSFYGNVVKIIDEEGYIFVYSNLDDNVYVKEGDNVSQKEIIGRVGVSASGELADETHLHFEVIKDQTQVNPLDLIN